MFYDYVRSSGNAEGRGRDIKKRGAEVAAKRKYTTANALCEKINEYFDAISTEEEVERIEFRGTDEDGHKIYEPVPVFKRNGERMMRTVWYTPPTVGGMCQHLGITRKTLSEYARRGGAYAVAVEHARSRVVTYLEEKISDPDIKNVKGVQLALESLLAVLEEEAMITRKKLSTADYASLLAEAAACGFIKKPEEETDADEK